MQVPAKKVENDKRKSRGGLARPSAGKVPELFLHEVLEGNKPTGEHFHRDASFLTTDSRLLLCTKWRRENTNSKL